MSSEPIHQTMNIHGFADLKLKHIAFAVWKLHVCKYGLKVIIAVTAATKKNSLEKGVAAATAFVLSHFKRQQITANNAAIKTKCCGSVTVGKCRRQLNARAEFVCAWKITVTVATVAALSAHQ